jgi:hypothetical protein
LTTASRRFASAACRSASFAAIVAVRIWTSSAGEVERLEARAELVDREHLLEHGRLERADVDRAPGRGLPRVVGLLPAARDSLPIVFDEPDEDADRVRVVVGREHFLEARDRDQPAHDGARQIGDAAAGAARALRLDVSEPLLGASSRAAFAAARSAAPRLAGLVGLKSASSSARSNSSSVRASSSS